MCSAAFFSKRLFHAHRDDPSALRREPRRSRQHGRNCPRQRRHPCPTTVPSRHLLWPQLLRPRRPPLGSVSQRRKRQHRGPVVSLSPCHLRSLNEHVSGWRRRSNAPRCSNTALVVGSCMTCADGASIIRGALKKNCPSRIRTYNQAVNSRLLYR